MKRESGRSPAHHFSFGERFDETLMKCYSNGNQSVRLSNHQFIGFSFIIKPAVEATEVSIAIRRLARRTSVLPTDKGKPTPPQAFGKQKNELVIVLQSFLEQIQCLIEKFIKILADI